MLNSLRLNKCQLLCLYAPGIIPVLEMLILIKLRSVQLSSFNVAPAYSNILSKAL